MDSSGVVAISWTICYSWIKVQSCVREISFAPFAPFICVGVYIVMLRLHIDGHVEMHAVCLDTTPITSGPYEGYRGILCESIDYRPWVLEMRDFEEGGRTALFHELYNNVPVSL